MVFLGWGRTEIHTGLVRKSKGKTRHLLEDLVVGGRIILKLFLNKQNWNVLNGLVWLWCWPVVNTVMNPRVPQNVENFLTS